MPRRVFLENWQDQLEATIADFELRIGPYSSPENDALVVELDLLKELRRQVRDVEPQQRQVVKSALLVWHAKQPLQFSDDQLSRLAELFDIYRRFQTRLTWNEASN